mmetsp:Transcript_22899/g.50899  ORF Transcript_22899/g.50899 Transcript_22899/m.50899 type:complete len:264 (-) Transcript_22899:474-1265(-)
MMRFTKAVNPPLLETRALLMVLFQLRASRKFAASVAKYISRACSHMRMAISTRPRMEPIWDWLTSLLQMLLKAASTACATIGCRTMSPLSSTSTSTSPPPATRMQLALYPLPKAMLARVRMACTIMPSSEVLRITVSSGLMPFSSTASMRLASFMCMTFWMARMAFSWMCLSTSWCTPRIRSNIACTQPLCAKSVLLELSRAREAQSLTHWFRMALLSCFTMSFSTVGSAPARTMGARSEGCSDRCTRPISAGPTTSSESSAM